MKKLLLLSSFVTAFTAAAPATVFAAELVAHWDFEHLDDGGTTIKSTVGGYVGTIFGAPAIVPANRPGGGGNGLDLSGGGTGGYIEIDPATSPDNLMNKAAADNAISIVYWEKNNKSPADGCCEASTFWADSPSSAHESRGVNIHTPWSNGEIMFDTTGCCTAGTRITVIPAKFDFTQWHHYAFIKNGVTKQIWIDGVLAKEGSGQDPLPDDFGLVTIGAQGAGDGHHSPNAVIDDFAIYKGALTAAEIKALAAGSAVVTPPDTVPPTLVSAVAGRTPGAGDFVTVSETVTLTFSEEVVSPGATNLANYSISPSLAVTQAQLGNGTSVTLTTGKTSPATLYTVSVKGVQDTAKNVIAANSQIQFVSFSVVTNGFLRFAAWGNIDGEPIDTLTSDPRYPASPDFVAAATSFDSQTVITDDSHIQYGATMTGILAPTETADYDFFLRSNERSELWLNANGTNPADAEKIASETSCCKNFVEPGASQTTATPIHLEAGKGYFIQAIYKRYTLNSLDLCQVAWRKTSDTTPAGHLAPIPGQFFTAEPTLGPSPLPSSISVSRQAGSATLTVAWTGGGTLQKADSLGATWTGVAGATSPHQVTASGAAGYFRIER